MAISSDWFFSFVSLLSIEHERDVIKQYLVKRFAVIKKKNVNEENKFNPLWFNHCACIIQLNHFN